MHLLPAVLTCCKLSVFSVLKYTLLLSHSGVHFLPNKFYLKAAADQTRHVEFMTWAPVPDMILLQIFGHDLNFGRFTSVVGHPSIQASEHLYIAHRVCVHSGSANEGAVLNSAALGDAAADEDDVASQAPSDGSGLDDMLAVLLAAVPEVAIPSIAVSST